MLGNKNLCAKVFRKIRTFSPNSTWSSERIAGSFNRKMNPVVKDIGHRGCPTLAPENTLLSFIAAASMGFTYVETDVTFTQDDVPILLHDITVDRVTGTTLGDVHQLNWSEIKDLYANKDPECGISGEFYPVRGVNNDYVKILSFEEFIKACRLLGLRPYIELGVWSADTSGWRQTKAQTKIEYDIVKKYGMLKEVTWISFSKDYLSYIKEFDPAARLGLLSWTIPSDLVAQAEELKTGSNEVFLDLPYTLVTDNLSNESREADIGIEVFTVDSEETVLGLNPYVSGVTSNVLFASHILEKSMLGKSSGLISVTERIHAFTPSPPAWGEYAGAAPGFAFTHLGSGLVRCTVTFNILKNSNTPKTGTVLWSSTEIPPEFVPKVYQSFAVPWWTKDSSGQEHTGVIRLGIGSDHDPVSANARKIVISELGEIPTTKANVRGSFIYSVER